MKCTNCGNEIDSNVTFCTSCGSRVDGAVQTPTGVTIENHDNGEAQINNQQHTVESTDNTKTNGLAIAGFTTSIVGFMIATIVIAPVAAILSAVALNQINKTGEKGKGLATAGIIIAIISIILIIIGYSTGIVGKN